MESSIFPDTDVNSLFTSLPDYLKLELIASNYKSFQLSEQKAKRKLFDAPPTEQEALRAFEESGVLGYIEGEVGTVYISNDDNTITIATVSAEVQKKYASNVRYECRLTSKTVSLEDFSLPSLENKTLDLYTRYLVKQERDPDTDNARRAFIDDWKSIVPIDTLEKAVLFAVSAHSFRAYSTDSIFLPGYGVAEIQSSVRTELDIDPEREEVHYRYFGWYSLPGWQEHEGPDRVIREWLADELDHPTLDCYNDIEWGTYGEDVEDVVAGVNSIISKCGYRVLYVYEEDSDDYLVKLVKK